MSSTTTQKASKKSIDMSTKIGGRIVQPALPVVDASLPTPCEQAFQSSLETFCQDKIPLESVVGIQTRERVLNRMGAVCRAWIKGVCHKRGLPPDVAQNAGGSLFTSGSYRLGVHEPGADIDTILVAPYMCSRQDFFGEILNDTTQERDPDSLAERIRRHADVTNFVPVEGAAVPILTFDWEGINIDLLFARLNSNSVPADFDIDNDAVLDGVDSATEKSLNGPRVTNLIAALVSGTPERYQTFLTVVRCVRKWAKARGLYSNKMGYWGGVNINIAVALCVQLYPLATPAALLRKFFLVFKTWRWPNPVMLTKPHDAGFGLTVWNAHSVNTARQVAPIITPAYPAMNSTLSVSRQTLQIMHEEFCRGHDIVTKLWKDHEQHYKLTGEPLPDMNTWKELFEPSDFFIAYPLYLSLCIVGPTQADAQAWAGFVESRLRKLTSDMLGRSLPLSKIQLWPKKIEACIADRGALLTQAQRRNCITYFIGFSVDKLRMRGDQLNVEQQLHHFREWELSRFQPLQAGMDICAKCFSVKELPKICFESYQGGKLEAMKKRRQRLQADPKRQEKKRVARLQQLKQKMAEIQKQKEAASKLKQEQDDADDNAKKRKRSESDDIDEEEEEDETAIAKKVKEEMMDVAAQVETNDNDDEEEEQEEEADLLESALDTIQGEDEGERKTREQAEADKRKLLEGQLLDDDEEDPYYQAAPDDDYDEEEEYTGDYRDSVVPRVKKEAQKKTKKNKYFLPLPDEDAEKLKQLGIPIVSDDETQILGTGMPPPWKHHPKIKWKSDSNNDNDKTTDDADDKKPKPKGKGLVLTKKSRIIFREQFDIVELDANGHVIDKGDDDFMPSKTWIGRKAGFEFKLGLRGLGYYRTGKKVVIPSNIAY